MRHLLFLLACTLTLAACKKAEPPAPTRPPGEVYSAPEGQYLFVRPPSWLRQVLGVSETPTLGGAATMVRWNLNVETTAPHTVLTLYTFPPEAWAPYAAADSAVGEVVFEDARRVIVAQPADPNPYAPADAGFAHYESLKLPPDSVRARLIVR